MAFKVFLDTNIVVDYFLVTREQHFVAKELFKKINNLEVQAFFSESVVNTTCYIVGKIFSTNDFKSVMTDLISFIDVLPCTNSIISDAYKNAKNDLEDAVLYHIALSGKMDYFVTSDKRDFKKIQQHSLPVVSSKEMLAILNP